MDGIDLVLQLTVSVFSIAAQWYYGNKSLKGPVIGMAGQILWWVIMVKSSLWGLMPINVAMVITHVRNYRKWRDA